MNDLITQSSYHAYYYSVVDAAAFQRTFSYSILCMDVYSETEHLMCGLMICMRENRFWPDGQ
jgi:hypothetical protein